MFLCECGKDFDTAIDLSLHQREFHSGNKVDALTVENAGAITASHQPAVAEPAVEAVDPATLKGKLADDFPGKTALEDAGYGTYAKVRKLVSGGKGWNDEIPGIGEATALKIQESLAIQPESEEEGE